MARYAFPSLFMAALMLFCCTSCIKTENDPCDDTVRPEIVARLKATVTVLTKDNQPIPNLQVNFVIYKIPCGAPAKGLFDFSGATNEEGMRTTTVVNYNLRNSEDQVVVDVHAVNLGNGSADADSEYGYYKYDTFTVGSTKEVHIFVYRNH